MPKPKPKPPKNLLERESPKREHAKGSAIEKQYADEKSLGDKQFIQKTDETVSQEKTGSDVSVPYASPSVFFSGANEFIFTGKGLSEQRAPESFNMTIHESIDDLYRYGEMVIDDALGFLEHTGLYSFYKDEKLSITLKGAFEGDVGRKIDFALYSPEVKQLDDRDESKRLKRIKFRMYEAPFFEGLIGSARDDSFRDNTSPQIIAKIMKKIGSKSLKIVHGKDPIFPSYIIPNQNYKKTIRYLQFYADRGPCKVFNISNGENTITVICPLEKLLKGELYPFEYSMVPSSSQLMGGAFKLGPYKIFGPTEFNPVGCLAGKTILTYDYFNDDKEKKPMEESLCTNKCKYSFEEGDEAYSLDKRTPGSIAAGIYMNGVKKVKGLGESLIYMKNEMSNKFSSFSVDEEYKPLAQAKLLNNFTEAYYNSFVLYTIISGKKEVNVGQIFDIEIPSANQGATDSTGNKDETLSGKWMLYEMVHKVKTVGGTGRVVYEMHCYFVRANFTVSNRAVFDKV